ncbi:MAG TPA: S-layer homology domain-containing protein [Candidatus Limnocylindria bacterium]|nr:S-layer homology domain-containing protein [Candidatus Limnocylindria bacterium]
MGPPRAGLAIRLVAGCVAALLALFGAPGPFAPPPALALPAIILVTTTSDDEFPADGVSCSLRAAILAANVGGYAGYCDPGTAEQDSIRFALGSGVPVINVGSDLPTITDPVTIRGNTGGATRVRLHGPGSGTGLTVWGTADGSAVRSMVIDNFTTGLQLDGSGVTVAGNILGPNTSYGVYAPSGGVIGGTIGVTPGGPCTGDCNLISGNGSSALYLASGGTIQGNFIGTTPDGLAANQNVYGITVSSGNWTIGGAAPGAGNLISGNQSHGLDLHGCTCQIQGNLIGTNVAGTATLPNGMAGISMENGYVTTISGNVIAGNAGSGIEVLGSTDVTIQGNWIGTTGDGSGALGNGGYGILLQSTFSSDSQDAVIGSATEAAAANVIAFNAADGIRMEASATKFNQVRGNSIHHNGGAGISLDGVANEGIIAPAITSIAPIAGTACPNCAVDLYSDSSDEGRIFEGSVTADGAGQWSSPFAVSGPKVTATNTNASLSTSEFSAPVTVKMSPFTDIAASQFKFDIEWLWREGITTGCTSTTFCPDAPVTRGQMAAFLVRALWLPDASADYFTDDETSIFEDDINRLAEAGITTGCGGGKYCPDLTVTREQMAAYLDRALSLPGTATDFFTDDETSIFEININRLAAAEITTGCTLTTFCPLGTVTRGQMAAFLHRALE